MADGAVGDLADAVEKPGAVILARHGQPALSRRCTLSADQYREWWADYEIGGLAEGQSPPQLLKDAAQRAGFIVASTRLRWATKNCSIPCPITPPGPTIPAPMPITTFTLFPCSPASGKA